MNPPVAAAGQNFSTLSKSASPDGPAGKAAAGAIPSALRQLIDSLPVSAHREPIIEAIRRHPVVIVCGETGSGKTTQLPKLCLAAGRGVRQAASGRGGLVGHTQPRRLAATSVAQRIAEELGTPLGADVGYKIRFNEKVSKSARIKLMTDGILLAETQADPLLSRYDTIIVDEAHERSLNIVFLLGYLKRLVDGPRRDDLKLVITSATIDAERFARHFAHGEVPAPVIEVSGRLFPVAVRYRPFQGGERPTAARSRPARAVAPSTGPSIGASTGPTPDDDDETDLPSAVEAAIDELWSEGPGDVLVFLPGEREIRDCADHLRRAAARAAGRAANGSGARGQGGRLLAAAEVIPLFARLSSADQQRVFDPGQALRIVLATNVAETSLTVPRIRYVVDSGLARVRRYRIRGKVEQLHVEPISQAAANQRAGRGGRGSDGICIRLFDEEDYDRRPRFTEPEILRSSLAAVILRMRSLGLEDVVAFPFLDPPSPKAIADGYALLQELGAMDEQRQLTRVGKQLARLPVDPRIARMLLAGHQLDCLVEVTVIAAALAAQDPRERPAALAQAADQAHARFADPRSDFLAWLRLWRYWQAQQEGRTARGESHRALAARLGREFLSVRRLREWADVHAQLAEIGREMKWSMNQAEAKPDPVHRALLTGLLGNIGHRAQDDSHYQGAHQQKFWLHPSSAVGRKAPAKVEGAAEAGAAAASQAKAGRWVMAAEMVDTGRLYARTVARIRSDWIESAGAHLIARSWTEPHWEKKAGQVMALERGVLYGLVIYAARRVPYGTIDPALARELMIREGLVAGEWPDELPFIRHNRGVIAEIERLEHKIRRPDLLVDEMALAAWFDSRIPAGICTAAALERWYRERRGSEPDVLQLSRDALLRKDAEGVDSERFPRHLAMHGVDFALDYHFEPGSANDGITMTVPLHLLNQVDATRCEWLVPGMLGNKVELLLKSLPQRHRRHLLPLAQAAADFVAAHAPASGGDAAKPLLKAISDHLRDRHSVTVAPSDFRPETLPVHLMMNFQVVDEHGRYLAMSRQLPQLKAQLGAKAQSSFQAAFARIAGSVTPVASGTAADEAATSAATSAAPPGRFAGRSSRAAAVQGGGSARSEASPSRGATGRTSTTWTFGELPELLELESPEGEVIVGFPALVDRGDAVELKVFDEPALAARSHHEGVRRLFMLAVAEPIRFFEREVKKNNRLELLFTTLPGNQAGAGSLAEQVVAAAIDRSFLVEGLPSDGDAFATRLAQGRPRFTLTAQELLRAVQAILEEHAGVRRKLAATRDQPDAAADIDRQLQELFAPGFICSTPFENLASFPRYLKAIVMRLEKLREQPQRDRALMAEMQPLLARWQRRQRALKGTADEGFESFPWLLQELRVSLFAQALRTPMPVSVKRLGKMLDQKEAQ